MGVDWQMTTTISIEDVHWEVNYGKHYWGIRIWSNSMMLLRMKTMSMLSWSTYISYSELTFHTNMIKFHEWIAACFLCHCKISKLFWIFFFKKICYCQIMWRWRTSGQDFIKVLKEKDCFYSLWYFIYF
jgi:hypothetical protein